MLNRMNNQRSGCRTPQMQNNTPRCNAGDSKALVKKLQMLDFSIAETVLYLDAYPSCRKALAYYQKLVAERQAVAKELAAMGKPMSSLCNEGNTWNWTSAPWPWEYEANV